MVSFAIGIGGTTMTAVLFFRFLKDFRISGFETNVIKTISQVIWFSLAVLILTEFALYLPIAEELIASPRFLAKILAIITIIISGVIINLLIIPLLAAISFKDDKSKSTGIFVRLRRITFGLGAVNLVSWYFAFVLDAIPTLSIAFPPLITTYAVLLVLSVAGSQAIEKRISKH